VIKRIGQRKTHEGETIALDLAHAPDYIVETAVKAANLVGDGLYGVDLKEVDGKAYVIEINDNPNIDAGNEDAIVGDALYEALMGVFAQRIEALRVEPQQGVR
jgi:glutathione synthase/RimK-type ligase-like ATP-grasp enzyme